MRDSRERFGPGGPLSQLSKNLSQFSEPDLLQGGVQLQAEEHKHRGRALHLVHCHGDSKVTANVQVLPQVFCARWGVG